MNQKQKQLLLGIFRQLESKSVEGQRLVRLIQAVDVGAITVDRLNEILVVKAHVDSLVEMMKSVQDSTDKLVGATLVQDQAENPKRPPDNVRPFRRR